MASDDQTDLEEALDAFSFGDDFGDDDTDGREDGKKNGLSEGDARGGRGGGGSSGVAQKPQTSEQMKRELGEALQLWLDALDGEIESEEAIRHSHELFAGRELSADAWKRLDSIRSFFSPTHPFLPYVAPHSSHISHFNLGFQAKKAARQAEVRVTLKHEAEVFLLF